MNYRFRYEYKSSRWFERTKDIEAPNPISAINQFHDFCQRTLFHGRKLNPKEYRVLKFAQFYYDAALQKDAFMQPVIESALDWPSGPNPDLGPKAETVVQETPEFKFS